MHIFMKHLPMAAILVVLIILLVLYMSGHDDNYQKEVKFEKLMITFVINEILLFQFVSKL